MVIFMKKMCKINKVNVYFITTLLLAIFVLLPAITTQSASKIRLQSNKSYIEVGDTFQVKLINSPNGAKQQIQWSVKQNGYYWGNDILKHIKKGTFKAVESGSVTVQAYNIVTKKTYQLDLQVNGPLGKFHIERNNKKVSTIKVFQGRHAIIDTVLNSSYDFRDKLEATYSIENKKIAKVDKRGQIKGVKVGTTTLKATAVNGKSVTCKVIVTKNDGSYDMDNFYADKSLNPIGISNYGSGSAWSETDQTFLYYLTNGKFCVIQRMKDNKLDSQSLFISYYNSDGSYVSKKTVSLPYSRWGGIYQAEDENYYVAVGQSNTEEDNRKVVYSILKFNTNFEELGRCNIIGSQCSTIMPFANAATRMDMDGKKLVVHTSRSRYMSEDGLNHQSNITFMIDTETMQSYYVGEAFPYNHVSHSFNQFVKVDGNNLIYVDHGDAYPRSVVMQTHYDFSAFAMNDDDFSGQNSIYTDLIKIKGATGDNYTGTTVSGFEIGMNQNIVAGVSIPHDKMTDRDFNDYKLNGYANKKSKNVYVSLVSKDGRSTETKWLTNYQDGSGISANNLRMVKLTDDKFAIIYKIDQEKDKTGLIVIDSNGIVKIQKEYETYFSGIVQPIYRNGYLTWIENIITSVPSVKEKCVFTRIYIIGDS